MNEQVEKWAMSMFEKEIAETTTRLEVAKICRDGVDEPEQHDYYIKRVADLEFYLNLLTELREYANV